MRINNVKNFIQGVLSIFGFQLTRLPRFVEPVVPFDVLELALMKALKIEQSEFYFIQVGSNAGLLNDPLNLLIRKYRLRGCLVEPFQGGFDILKRNYSDQPQLAFRNVMIGSQDGLAEIKRLRRMAPAFANFCKGHTGNILASEKSDGTEADVETVTYRMQTFETLLASLPLKLISMLSVNTKGGDEKIIEAAFKAGVFPAIINYEWTDMPLETRFAIKMKLLDHGYRFVDIGADTVCVRVNHDQSEH